MHHHGLQHARPPCPSLSPGAFSNSCPSSQWYLCCHLSSSVIPFSSWLPSFPAPGSFPVSQFFASVAKVLEFQISLKHPSVLPMNIQYWFLLGLNGLISYSPRDSQESSPIPQFKSINSSALSFLYGPAFTSILLYIWIHSRHQIHDLKVSFFHPIICPFTFSVLSFEHKSF